MTADVSVRQRKRQRTRAALEQAALELFAARGFAAVTLAEVADAADVGHRTLFRYFAAKEDLLFGDDDEVRALLRAALAARPASEPPATAVVEALTELAPLWQDRRDHGRVRRAVIDASPALRARERAKHLAHEQVLLDGLAARGVGLLPARLLARTAVACAEEAVARWLADEHAQRPGLAGQMRDVVAELGRLLGPPREHASD